MRLCLPDLALNGALHPTCRGERRSRPYSRLAVFQEPSNQNLGPLSIRQTNLVEVVDQIDGEWGDRGDRGDRGDNVSHHDTTLKSQIEFLE